MQNHLDTSQHQRSYTSMLQADPFGGGGPTSHQNEYTTLNHNGSPGSEYLLIPNNNNSLPNNHNNHGGPHHHNNNHNNNNNNGGSGHRLSEKPEVVEKPKKQPPPNGKKTKGRVKIKMEFIDNKLRRYTTFSKRKTGIMKKAYELSTLTGTQVMLLVASETGHVYTFATRKLQPMITSEAGKALIQTCLNSPDPPIPGDSQRMSATGYEETELTYAADPNSSDHGESKDGESSDVMSCSDGEDQIQQMGSGVPPLLPLNNGLLPANFAALFASASAAGLGVTKGGLTIDLTGGAIRDQGRHNNSQDHHHQHHHLEISTSTNTTSSTSTTGLGLSISPSTTIISSSHAVGTNSNPSSQVTTTNNNTSVTTIPVSHLTSSSPTTTCLTNIKSKLKRDLK